MKWLAILVLLFPMAAIADCGGRNFETHAKSAYDAHGKWPVDYWSGPKAIEMAWRMRMIPPPGVRKGELAVWFVNDVYSAALYIGGCLWQSKVLNRVQYNRRTLTGAGDPT